MQNITLQQAQQIVVTLDSKQALHTSRINVASVIDALHNVAATTFATLTQASRVATKQRCPISKAQNIFKVTMQNVTLCNSSANLYTNAVTREVVATAQAEAFTALPSNYVMVDGSYSVCALKSNTRKHYLRATVNSCIAVVYYCANTHKLLSKEEVAQFLTPSAADKLLQKKRPNVVQHANITHNVTVRNFALQNIYSLNVAKQQLMC